MPAKNKMSKKKGRMPQLPNPVKIMSVSPTPVCLRMCGSFYYRWPNGKYTSAGSLVQPAVLIGCNEFGTDIRE